MNDVQTAVPTAISDFDAGRLMGEMLNIATGAYRATFTPEGKEVGLWEGRPALFDYRHDRTAAFVFSPEGEFEGFWVQTPDELVPDGNAKRVGGFLAVPEDEEK